MSKYVIGIDPGATKGHGVSTYENGKLIRLDMMTLMQLMTYLSNLMECHCSFGEWIELQIEDVKGKKGAWHGENQNKKAIGKTGEHLGYCKWAQVEVERMCGHLGVNVTKHKVSSAWKNTKNKAQFEKVTGWTGRSNEDTRSAAYFGYLGL